MSHTLKKAIWQLAQEAISIQDAVNLRGVLYSWWEALCQDVVGRGSPEELNLNALYLSKVTFLLRADADSIGTVSLGPPKPDMSGRAVTFNTAYEWAKKASEVSK